MAKQLKRAVRPLEESPSHLLHLALQTALGLYIQEVGPDGLTQRQFAVLTVASATDGLTQSALVKATGVDRSTMAELVARMTRKGLLARERASDDGRANAVRVTEAGRAALAEAEPRVAAADARILELLKPSRRKRLIEILKALVAAADPTETAEASATKTGNK